MCARWRGERPSLAYISTHVYIHTNGIPRATTISWFKCNCRIRSGIYIPQPWTKEFRRHGKRAGDRRFGCISLPRIYARCIYYDTTFLHLITPCSTAMGSRTGRDILVYTYGPWPVTLPPLLHSALCISRSCLPCVTCFSFSIVPALTTILRFETPFHARVINVTDDCHGAGKLNSRKIGRQKDHLSGVRMPSFSVPCCCVVCFPRVTRPCNRHGILMWFRVLFAFKTLCYLFSPLREWRSGIKRFEKKSGYRVWIRFCLGVSVSWLD